jgi:hypothetical protein
LLPAPDCFEDGVKLAIEELQEVNLGTPEKPRPTFIAASLPEPEAHNLVKFLREYKDCFAWTYSEMPGLDPQVVTHSLAVNPEFSEIFVADEWRH